MLLREIIIRVIIDYKYNIRFFILLIYNLKIVNV